MEHISVLKNEVLDGLDLHGGEVVVDATLGLGGHALEILKRIGKKGLLIGFDQDEVNLGEAGKRLKKYTNVVFVHDNFRYLKNRVNESVKNGQVDAVLFDLGLSSPHIDEGGRGFSFLRDGPLDMRFSKSQKLTARDVVNAYSEADLVKIFSEYGEERFSKTIARKICERRKEKVFEGTLELADFISGVVPVRFKVKGFHPATQVFQALRIEVNDELNALKEALYDSISILKIGGRVVVISYHSLEDRIVKHFFKDLARSCVCPIEQVVCTCGGEPFVEILTRRPVTASASELKDNPRARSAKLRVCKKLKNLP